MRVSEGSSGHKDALDDLHAFMKAHPEMKLKVEAMIEGTGGVFVRYIKRALASRQAEDELRSGVSRTNSSASLFTRVSPFTVRCTHPVCSRSQPEQHPHPSCAGPRHRLLRAPERRPQRLRASLRRWTIRKRRRGFGRCRTSSSTRAGAASGAQLQ
jgi:hypothetical protein